MVQKTVAHYGRLDVFFNNAGIERHAPIAAMDLAEHRRVIDVDLNGVYYCLQAVIRAMADNEGPSRGAIVNTASVAGLMTAPSLMAASVSSQSATTLGSITHSAPSTKFTRIHSLMAHGSTPAVSARFPNTISRSMWCV